MIPAVGDLESIVIELDDPNWNIWVERLADFQTRVQIGRYRQNIVSSLVVADAGSPAC